MAAIQEVLAGCSLFKDLTDDEMNRILPLCREQSYAAGLSVISEGVTARDLYIVDEGRVIVEMNLSAYPGMVQNALIESIPTGEPFGWSAVVGSRIYTMTARCMEATRVIAIDGEHLLELFNNDPALGFKVMCGLVEVINDRVRNVIRTVTR